MDFDLIYLILSSPRMLQHIRDFCVLFAGKLKLNQDKTKTGNRENDPKVANSTHVLQIYGQPSFVSL